MYFTYVCKYDMGFGAKIQTEKLLSGGKLKLTSVLKIQVFYQS